MIVASCSGCNANWRCLQQDLNPELTEGCPDCGAPEVRRVRIDLDSGTVEAGYQDSAGKAIRVGDSVRFSNQVYVIEKLGLPDTGSGRGVKLVGREEPVGEWGIDLVSQLRNWPVLPLTREKAP